MKRSITVAIVAVILFVAPIAAAQQSRAPTAIIPLSTVEEIHGALFRAYISVPDIVQYGVWDDQRSHADTVRKGGTFKDDCDGFAITCRDLMLSVGIPAWLVQVEMPRISDGYQHMFCAFRDPEDGIIKTIDDLYPRGIRTYQNTLKGSMYRNPIEIGRPPL